MLNLWMYWEKLYPNVSLTVKNKIGSLHKMRLFTFQILHDEWDISVPQI